MSLFLAQHEVHDPAAPDMRPRLTAVVEDLGVVAPGFFKSFGQKRQALVVSPFIVDRLGQGKDGPLFPSGVEGDWAVRVADDVPEQVALANVLFSTPCKFLTNMII